MKVKIKKLVENAVIPKYAKPGDAGLDLVAVNRYFEKPDCNMVYTTGLSIEIPEGYVGLIFPRSSICKYDLTLTNCVGVIDSGFRGEITLKFGMTREYYLVDDVPYFNGNHTDDYAYNPMKIYEVGDKIGQLIILPYPQIEFEEVEELSITERGELGYGSTGL